MHVHTVGEGDLNFLESKQIMSCSSHTPSLKQKLKVLQCMSGHHPHLHLTLCITTLRTLCSYRSSHSWGISFVTVQSQKDRKEVEKLFKHEVMLL